MSDDQSNEVTRQMPVVPPQPGQPPAMPPQGGQPPDQQWQQPPSGGSSSRTWLIVALAVIAGILLGLGVTWFAMGGRLQVVPPGGTAETTTAPAVVATVTTPVEATTPPPPVTPPPTATKKPTQPTTPADTTPPHTPDTVSPHDGGKISFQDESVELKWSKVSDPSDVRYTVQIGKAVFESDTFTAVKTVKGLHDTHYTLERGGLWSPSDIEALTIRWRVWAVDGEGNASDYSDWSKFEVVSAE